MRKNIAWQQCIRPDCAARYDIGQSVQACPKCSSLLDVLYDWDRIELPKYARDLGRPPDDAAGGPCSVSGVWRFGCLLPFAPPECRQTIGEGHTQLRSARAAAHYAGIKNLWLQYEGLNPSGSFKDNGMAGAFTHAHLIGAEVMACASTGNTSASLAAFSAASGRTRAIIFVGDGKIAYGKLSQALDYGALTLLVKGDFDDAMSRVQEVSRNEGIYLVNSVNPFRLEGQKTTMFRVLEGFNWNAPDWIVCPGGNLGNSSAFAKALDELHGLGYLDKPPRLAVVNAEGAPTLDRLVNRHGIRWNAGQVDREEVRRYYQLLDQRNERAHTLASAIEINRPVNLEKCLRGLERLNGVVITATDQEILDAKAWIARDGLGCEPASAASVAGAKKLVEMGVIDRDERVACILTGHQLKDPHATVAYHSYESARLSEEYGSYGVTAQPACNRPVQVANDTHDIIQTIRRMSGK